MACPFCLTLHNMRKAAQEWTPRNKYDMRDFFLMLENRDPSTMGEMRLYGAYGLYFKPALWTLLRHITIRDPALNRRCLLAILCMRRLFGRRLRPLHVMQILSNMKYLIANVAIKRPGCLCDRPSHII